VVAVSVFGLPPFTSGPSADYLAAEKVSAHTPMPGVTPEMVRWWFANYMQTSEHYKRWYPDAHIWMD